MMILPNTEEAQNGTHTGNVVPFVRSPERKLSVRPDRLTLEGLDCRLHFSGISIPVLDAAPFGIAVAHDEALELPVQMRDARLSILGHEIARLDLRQVRKEYAANDRVRTAMAITGEPLPVERITGVREARSLLGRIHKATASRSQVPDAFARQTLELKEVLTTYQQELNDLEQRLAGQFLYPEDRKEVEAPIISLFGETIQQEVDPRVNRLKDAVEGLSSDTLDVCFTYFRSRLGELLNQSPFSCRSYEKPLGYAGDYEMMNMLYYNQGLGQSLFARCLQAYIIQMPGGRAVRNRAHYLHSQILALLERRKDDDRPIKIMSVAAGPAMEMQLIFQNEMPDAVDRLELHLLDQDIQSLKFAQRRLRALILRSGRNCITRLHHCTIKQVIKEGLDEQGFDLIYSAGLFDYLSEPVAYMTARRLFSPLERGGHLIIGNFAVTSPSRFCMELFWDWRLVYRSVDEMQHLGDSLEGSASVDSEPEHINLFSVIRR